MARLSLALLGTPEVRHGGAPLAFRTRKALALLVYLAVEGGALSRDKLTAFFWPESDERHGRMMLRRTLAFLRQNLGEDAPGHTMHLTVTREALGFEFASDHELDLRRLEQAAAGRPGQGDDLDALRDAVRLYRGDFLDGFSLGDAPEFDDWVGTQREYWRRRMQTAFDRLTRRQAEAGDRTAALASLARWLALDPLNESAYQRLMQAHLGAGDRAAALEVYEAARAALARELGVEPAPETQALAERARSARQPQPARAAPRQPALAEGPLVGRSDAFSQLVEAYHAARLGRVQLVMVEGEAGIGKTRLATEFLSWAAAEGAQTLTGQAFEAGGRLPYQPVVEALRTGLAADAGRPPNVGEVWLGEIARLLPELREQRPELPAAQDPAAAQARLFEAVARWAEALAARVPLVLLIDDIHWADTASLDLLQYCARRWAARGAALLLLCTFRSELLAAPGSQALPRANWLAGLQRDLPLIRLSLGPLNLPDTVRYLEGLAGGTEPGPTLQGFARWLFAETNGQPFFLVETLKALLQQHVLGLRPRAGGEWALDLGDGRTVLENVLPPGVRELIRGRISRLGPEAFGLLAAGAVLGQEFSFEALCRVAGLSEDAGLPAWDELLASGLLAEVGGPPQARYRFSHDKIRDVTYTEAGEARRRIFHRRAFAALEAEGAPAATLAHHAWQGGQTMAAYRYSRAAGDDAMRVYAVRDAVALYEAARRAAALLEKPAGLGQLHLRLGRAQEAAGDYARARGTYEATLDLARAAPDPPLECVTLNRLATLAGIHTFENPEVGQFLQQALLVAEASGDTLGRAETEWNLAHFAFYAGDLEAARDHGQRALALAGKVDARELLARSLNVLGYVELGANNWAAAEAWAEQAQPLYAALGDRAGVTDSLLQLANARLNSGRLRAGLEPARAARAISHEIENTWGLVLSDVHLAHGLREAGEYAEALAVAEEGARLGRELGMNALLIFMLAELGAMHRSLLNLEAARLVHLEAQAINEKFPTQPFGELVAVELCADLALAGDWIGAGVCARQAVARRGGVKVPFFGLTLWLEAEALIRAGEVEAARADVKRFGASSVGNPRFRIPYLRALAALAMADDQIGAATAHLRQAGALARELGLPGEQWPIEAALAELHGSRGAESEMRRAASEAARIVQSLAAAISDEKLRASFLSAEAARRVLGA